MKKTILLFFALLSFSSTGYAEEADIVVLQDGQSLKVYNLDIMSSDNVYYTLSEEEDAPLRKLKKSEILIIKKADGTKIDPNAIEQPKTFIVVTQSTVKNPAAHNPITVTAIENNFLDVVTQKAKKGKPEVIDKYILAKESNGQILNLRLVSDDDKELSVAKLRDGYKFETSEIIIPEYVIVNGERFSITQIDPSAFDCKGKGGITNIVFPETLRQIGESAFYRLRHLKRIVLPESVETIGYDAFSQCGNACQTFEQLYIPKGVKQIEERAFWYVGPNTSWNAYFQGNLTSIPDFISTGNCTGFGIDEEAVEAYMNRHK